jgi:hypothetical protein
MRILLLALPGLPPAWGVSGGIWKPSPAWIMRVGLTLDGKLEAALQDVGGFDSRMRVAPDSHPRVYGRVHEDRRIARRRTVGLRQNLSRDAGRGRSRRTLG